MSRREKESKKKKSKSIFLKDSKKRVRSTSNSPSETPKSGTKTTTDLYETKKQSNSSGTKVNYKSLPKGFSKITASHSHTDVPDEEKPSPVRRSLSIGEINELNSNKIEYPTQVNDVSTEKTTKKEEIQLSRGKCSSAGVDSSTFFSSNNPNYERDFKQFEEIAQTSTGCIYRAQSKLSKQFYAIKKISFPHFDESQQSYDQLLHEVYTLSQLSHPNIVKYHHSWIEFEERPNTNSLAVADNEDNHHSFMIQLPSTNIVTHVNRTSSLIDDTSLSESIDSSITAITFTEYALTSDTENFDDDPTDEATDDFPTDNFPFGEDTPRTPCLPSQDKVTLYIQMELCTTTLQDYLNQRNSINEKQSLNIFTQLLLGVKYLHEKNLMHRDLRPSNIFLFQQQSTDAIVETVKIGDFSVSTDQVPYLISSHKKDYQDAKNHEDDEQIVGDYSYASPELRRGATCFQSTDIFSLGVILFELFHNCTTNREKYLRELRRRVLPSELLLNHSTVVSIFIY